MAKKYKHPIVFTRFVLVGATGQVIGLADADALPDGTTHEFRLGVDKEWVEIGTPKQAINSRP